MWEVMREILSCRIAVGEGRRGNKENAYGNCVCEALRFVDGKV